MIEFLLGLSIGAFLTGILLANRRIIQASFDKIEHSIQIPRSAEFFESSDMAAEAIAEVISENEKRGKGTNLNEL